MALMGMSLEEALTKGRGTERPFRCTSHDDTMASATVNVLKGLWFCHACHAKGKVTGKTAPKAADLLAMMEPEKAARHYTETYLEMFNWVGPKYWETRLAPWVVHQLRMGEDPVTGDATFPVHTPSGILAGVGRRHITDDKQKRYLYPNNWSAAQSLFGLHGKWKKFPVIVLVEGAADAASVWEVGCPAFAVYGSGLHLPQIELVARLQPGVVLFGFDMDDAGEEATSRGYKQLSRMGELRRVRWPKSDPNECAPSQRLAALTKAVGNTRYGESVVPLWANHVAESQATYERFVRDSAHV